MSAGCSAPIEQPSQTYHTTITIGSSPWAKEEPRKFCLTEGLLTAFYIYVPTGCDKSPTERLKSLHESSVRYNQRDGLASWRLNRSDTMGAPLLINGLDQEQADVMRVLRTEIRFAVLKATLIAIRETRSNVDYNLVALDCERDEE